MTAPRLRRTRGPFAGMRRGGALMAVLALAGLATLGLPGAARGASPSDSYNQMTGVGTAASSLTVKWTQGLLNAQNQPITTDTTDLSPNSDRAAATATSPLSFMYADFKKLQVTVSQTENITHQGITVSWTGGEQSSPGAPYYNFLQMMECYGNPSTGLPSPEDCEYGSAGMLGAQAVNPGIGDRGGNLCSPGSTPSTDPSKTPTGPQAPDPAYGCDTKEPGSDTPPHCDPQAPPGTSCNDGIFYIPFRPVDDPAHPIYEQENLPAAFSEFNSNEVQAAGRFACS